MSRDEGSRRGGWASPLLGEHRPMAALGVRGLSLQWEVCCPRDLSPPGSTEAPEDLCPAGRDSGGIKGLFSSHSCLATSWGRKPQHIWEHSDFLKHAYSNVQIQVTPLSIHVVCVRLSIVG